MQITLWVVYKGRFIVLWPINLLSQALQPTKKIDS